KELKEVIRREPITSESEIRTKIDKFYTNLFELTESEFSVISNFIQKSVKSRLAGNEYFTKDN
ncbi:MAG: hypothetical protein KAT16_07740, partial [Candidatus Heimdallarchaeota archaeon]|nr:hypothetical protein [Candidatus Heimdallarchaeota archaeon]